MLLYVCMYVFKVRNSGTVGLNSNAGYPAFMEAPGGVLESDPTGDFIVLPGGLVIEKNGLLDQNCFVVGPSHSLSKAMVHDQKRWLLPSGLG